MNSITRPYEVYVKSIRSPSRSSQDPSRPSQDPSWTFVKDDTSNAGRSFYTPRPPLLYLALGVN